MTADAREKVMQALHRGEKIVFADETVFTKNTLPRRSFCVKGKNVTVDQKDLGSVYRSALAAISTEGKLEHLKVTEKAINGKNTSVFSRK